MATIIIMSKKTNAILNASPADISRFLTKVNRDPGQGPCGSCWEWVGHKTSEGYGRYDLCGESVLSHRAAYWLYFGGDLYGVIRHKCDNPPCCNPEHLESGTLADNNMDKVLRGRSVGLKGEYHPSVKLKEQDVLTIRSRSKSGESYAAIAREFNVTRQLIRQICIRKIWGHLP